MSHRIHANPELGFEERLASTWLCEMLADAGFKMEAGICDMPTAFVARAGSGPLHVGICAEYDSLPQIGHACGHNIIAAMALGAGIAAAKVADEAGLTVSMFGTPAEEIGDGGGKILMLERGGFSGIHAAMMVHPAPIDTVEMASSAVATFETHYTGKEAHAGFAPELGINALDALTIAQTAIGLLRQHIRATDRIHGIITHGGDAPNVIPAHTNARFMVRAKNVHDLDEIRDKVFRCFEAGALATVRDWKSWAEKNPTPSCIMIRVSRRCMRAMRKASAAPLSSCRTEPAAEARPTWETSRSRFPRFIRRSESPRCRR